MIYHPIRTSPFVGYQCPQRGGGYVTQSVMHLGHPPDLPALPPLLEFAGLPTVRARCYPLALCWLLNLIRDERQPHLGS